MNRKPIIQGGLAAEATGNAGDSQGDVWRRRFWPVLLLLCIAGSLMRLFILQQYWAENPFARSLRSDASAYWTWAGRIAAGLWREPTPFLSAPLYPYVLGLIRWCGGGFLSVYAVQIVFDVLSALGLGLLGRMRYGAGVGLLAAAIFLFMFEPASFCLRILGVSMQMTLVCAALITMAVFQRRKTWPAAALCGLVLGINCLATPAMMLVLPFAVGWMWWITGVRAAARSALPGLIGAAAAIAPATLHNWSRTGEFIPVSVHAGITLYQGNVPGAGWAYSPVPGISREREQMHVDTARFFAREIGRPGTWGEIDRHFVHKTLASWREHPLDALKRMGLKAYAFLTARNYGDIYNPELEAAEGLSQRLNLAPLRTAWLMPLAIVALVFRLRSPRENMPEVLLFLGSLAVVILFWYSPRYRAPAIPVVAITAAWMLRQGWLARRSVGSSAAIGGAVIAAVGFGLLNRAARFDSIAEQQPDFECGLGIAFADVGNFNEAVARYQIALRANPGDVDTAISLSNALRELGRLDEAMALARQAIAREPESTAGHISLAITLIQRGAIDEAVQHFQEATRINPTLVIGQTNLGIALSQQGRLAEALEHHRIAATLDPSSALVQYNLGCTLMKTQALDEAAKAFRLAIRLEPSFSPAYSRLAPLLLAQGRYAEAIAVFRQGLRQAPDDPSLTNDLAWLLATSPVDAARNGPEAVRLATKTCEQSRRRDSNFLDTLAAAYAETGEFARAVATAKEAIDLAVAAGHAEQAQAIAKRMALYQTGRPFRGSPPPQNRAAPTSNPTSASWPR